MNTTTCPAHHLPALSPAPPQGFARLKGVLAKAIQSWRDSALRRAEWRALDALDDRTLHDIGLAERRTGRDLPGVWRDIGAGR